jgi:hypothetical protein
LNYNGISYWFICNYDVQYKPKAIIMLNLVLPLVGIMNIVKINQYQIHYNIYGYRLWFNGFKYTKVCSFHMKQNNEI